MPAKYDGACGLVVPTFWAQGFDLTVAESLARRRPVVCSHTGSYGRFSEQSKYVRAVPVGDWGELARVLSEPVPSVSCSAADIHKPGVHAMLWLEKCA